MQDAISAALAQDRAARARAWRQTWDNFGTALAVVGGVWACIAEPLFLIPAALFGLFAMACSERPWVSFIGRWAWKLIGYGIAWGVFWLWLQHIKARHGVEGPCWDSFSGSRAELFSAAMHCNSSAAFQLRVSSGDASRKPGQRPVRLCSAEAEEHERERVRIDAEECAQAAADERHEAERRAQINQWWNSRSEAFLELTPEAQRALLEAERRHGISGSDDVVLDLSAAEIRAFGLTGQLPDRPLGKVRIG